MMQRFMGFLGCAALLATAAVAKERHPLHLVADPGEVPDPALVEGLPPTSQSQPDTVWIADWSFDVFGGGCTDAGWLARDLRLENDGALYWSVQPGYGNGSCAAVLRKHDLCWAQDGYGNDWDQSIVLDYAGSGATLSVGFYSDSEPGFDFVTVEADSLGLSESRVNYEVDPRSTPEKFRDELFTTDGDNTWGVSLRSLALPDYGPGTHEVYIRFTSDGGYSDEDGDYPTVGGYGLVVDDIVVTGDIAYSEAFDCPPGGALGAHVRFENTAPTTPFGQWGRLYQHVTDNDKCTENTTCAWLWSDPTLHAYYPDMEFGPGGAVVRNWLYNDIVSPWVSLASTPGAVGTTLSFRRFPANHFGYSRIEYGWRLRSRLRIDNTDTSAPGDSIECATPWQIPLNVPTLPPFIWVTSIQDVTPFMVPGATAVQASFRVYDYRLFVPNLAPPATLNPGPGPYFDRVRIGRRTMSGPVVYEGIDARTQAQDCFATSRNAIAPGEHFSPSGDRFGTCAFSMGADLGIILFGSPNLITGDSITVEVSDVRGAGGVTSVRWYGAVVSGPHAGKAPAPYAVGANGFFETTADTMRNASGAVLANRWTRDLDDTYFRGGDELVYFWAAADAGGGFASMPKGLVSLPASVAAAEAATGGLYEVSFLPDVEWDPAYLAAIAADPHGDIDPTPEQVANSRQAHCILYYQHVTSRRRSGTLQTTSFMRTLDALGYRGSYDVYDVSGYGNTNNQLGGRATLAQLTGYRLIVEDDGRSGLIPNIPDGSSVDTDKVNQAQFYRDWLAGGGASEAGMATLWLIGESTAYERRTNALFTSDFGIASVVDNQVLSVNPDVEGVANRDFANGIWGLFTGDRFILNGGCPTIRRYDGYTPTGTAVATHLYRTATGTGPAAVVMNRNAALRWNTIAMGFAWFDIRDAYGGAPGSPARDLAAKILSGVLGDCAEPLDPTGVPEGDAVAVPRLTVLHPNVPNPFNPATKLSFDLAIDGRVRLEIYDVAGHCVRVVLDATLPAGFGHSITWNGLDDAGRRAPSGVYLARLRAGDAVVATRRLVLLK